MIDRHDSLFIRKDDVIVALPNDDFQEILTNQKLRQAVEAAINQLSYARNSTNSPVAQSMLENLENLLRASKE